MLQGKIYLTFNTGQDFLQSLYSVSQKCIYVYIQYVYELDI